MTQHILLGYLLMALATAGGATFAALGLAAFGIYGTWMVVLTATCASLSGMLALERLGLLESQNAA